MCIFLIFPSIKREPEYWICYVRKTALRLQDYALLFLSSVSDSRGDIVHVKYVTTNESSLYVRSITLLTFYKIVFILV